MILIGAVSVLLLYLGLRALGSGDLVTSFMYFGSGFGGFLVVGFQWLKMRNVDKEDIDHEKKVFTTLECNQCAEKTEQPFTRGDHIYKNTGSCTACSGQRIITKISTPELNE
jgi:hypothetical protein